MSMTWSNDSGAGIHESEVNFSPSGQGFLAGGEVLGTMFEEALSYTESSETDKESVGSSEDMDSPRSEAMFGRRRRVRKRMLSVHSQILRIREEDSKNIGESELIAIDKLKAQLPVTSVLHHHHHHRHQIASNSHKDMNVMLFARPILPASPLSGKMAIKPVH